MCPTSNPAPGPTARPATTGCSAPWATTAWPAPAPAAGCATATTPTPCTLDACDEQNDRCTHSNRPNGFGCEDGLFCTSGDSCQNGACVSGTQNTCTVSNPCTSNCDEVNDTCGGCVPAGTRCLNSVQQVTCDGSCGMTELIICPYGCNATRQRCNECAPSSVECRGDAEQLCNAEFTFSADGRLLSVVCCATNRCICDRSVCLEDECFGAPDLSAGGTLTGTTCDDFDHIPGDCNPGGTACRTPAQGGAPEQMFQFTLDDGNPSRSFFYTVALDTAGSAIDTGLRVSRVCCSETQPIPFTGVCDATPATSPRTACSQQPTLRDSLRLCGLPEGTYYGSVESPASACGSFSLSLARSPSGLDTAPFAGNVSQGGLFRGNTCSLIDNYAFPDEWTWASGNCGNCRGPVGGLHYCPACSVTAASDCTLSSNGVDEHCAYSGAGSKDAVFYLALSQDSGVDISTAGSNFDTVLYVMQTGPNGALPPGLRRICNDDCWTSDGPSHIQTSLPAGVYYVYLDGAGGACGDYVLRVIVSPAATCGDNLCEGQYESCLTCPLDCFCPHCGDGIIQTFEGERCDDHNGAGGDCCGSNCVEEAGCACYGEPSTCGVPFTRDGSHTCNCAIPDGTNTGCGVSLVDTLSIAGACTVVGVTVDMNLTHPYVGDLMLVLRGPDGTEVTLHNRSGGDTDNLVGSYEQTLTADGPGRLSDFVGRPGGGTWTLTATDCSRTDTGILNSWAVHLQCL